MFPYLDLLGFKTRTIMPKGDVELLESNVPGWLIQAIAGRSSYINGRLRKRYGNAAGVSQLPFGQQAPALLASDALSPAVSLIGRPTLGSIETRIEISLSGGLGVAIVRYSFDNGQTWTSGVLTAPIVPLAYGLSASFPTGTYLTTQYYIAATPVPECVLRWLTTLVTDDAYRKRGRNPQDPAMVDLKDDVDRVYAELKEAADSKDGLFDLPVSEDADSAIVTGGPLGFADSSPYAWQDRQVHLGHDQDRQSPSPQLPPAEVLP